MSIVYQQASRKGWSLAILWGIFQLLTILPASQAPAAHSQNIDVTAAEQAWLAAHPVIRIAGPKAFPPFQYVSDENTIAGMASGYIAILQDRLGIRVEAYPELLWPEVLQRAQNRELDVITCAAKSADREQYLLFSTPYLSFPMVIVTRKDAGFLSGLDDLHHVSVAVIKGTSTYEWMERDRIGFLPYIVGSPLEGLQAVALGRTEAYVGNLASISYQIEREGLANLKVAAPTPYGNYDLHFAVRSDWPELLSIINKTLASIAPEEHSAIRQRWIAVRYEYGIDPSMLWRISLSIGAVCVVLVGMVLLRNWQVHRSEERFRGFLEYGADMILACKADGTILYQSPSFTPLLDYRPKELLNTAIQKLLHQDDLSGWQHMIASLLRSSEPQTLLHRFRHCQGHYLYVESHCVNLLENRAVRAIVVNARDLTEHITTEHALQQARDTAREAQHAAETAQRASEAAQQAAEDANVAKSAFLANMSHELRTPLNAILGFSQILVRDSAIGPEQRESLNIIRHSGEHLLSLINDVLNMSKIEAGRMTLREENIDLHRLLRDIEDMFRLPARQKGLTLNVQCEPDVPQYVRIDAVKLRQILLNLLSNAMKFTDEGSVTVRIELSSAPKAVFGQAAQLHFSISDTGLGIAEADIPKLFEPFVQIAQTAGKMYEGTGLGLPISQRFVRMLGGELTVRSALGKGTIFYFHIQVATVVADDVQQVHSALSHIVGIRPGQPTYRILVVDDHWESRQLLIKFMQPLGFDVQDASNGQEAVEIVQQWHPHLVWMDMRMPVMDGYDATQRIRELDAGIPIIALTASSFEEERAFILKNGCDDFLRKPFEEFEIFNMLRKHLGVQFLSEDIPMPEEKPVSAAVIDDSLELKFLELPETILHDFQYAVEGIDIEEISECLVQISVLNSDLADALSEIIKAYRFDVLQRILEKVHRRHEENNDE